MLATIISGTAQGFSWVLLTLGVYITFRLLDFADLTVEGSFPLGAGVSVVLVNAGVNPFLAFLIAFVCGMTAGAITGFLNTVCKIPPILSGILTMISLYSINLRIQSGRATVTFQEDTARNIIAGWLPDGFSNNSIAILVGAILAALTIAILYFFFGTEIGAALRATGNNPYMARALSVNTKAMTVLGLMLSNGLIAASGSFYAQFDYGSAIVTMGQGSIVIGLASVIIGEVLFCHKDHSFAYKLTAIVIGALIYRIVYSLALYGDFMEETDLKLVTAVIVVLMLSVPVIKDFIASRHARAVNTAKYKNGGAADA